MARRTDTRIRRIAATAMPIPMPALAPTDMPDALLTKDVMGKALADVVKRRARRGVARLNIEDMVGIELVFFDLRSTRRVVFVLDKGSLGEIAVEVERVCEVK
jgi:hypothetical protein